MSHPKLILLLPAAAGVITASLSGCGSEPEATPDPPRPVYTTVVPEPVAEIQRRFTGQVETAEGANLAFEVNGRATAVAAKEGARYKQGDVLAKVDDSSFRNQLTSDQATLKNAEERTEPYSQTVRIRERQSERSRW